MTFQISKDFDFSADHALTGLSPEHKCARFHGHNYKVRVALESDLLGHAGFVRDYGDLFVFKEYLDAHFDHRWLGAGVIARVANAAEPGSASSPILTDITHPIVTFNPTAENLARFFYDILTGRLGIREVTAVGVSETDKTWAWYHDLEKITYSPTEAK